MLKTIKFLRSMTQGLSLVMVMISLIFIAPLCTLAPRHLGPSAPWHLGILAPRHLVKFLNVIKNDFEVEFNFLDESEWMPVSMTFSRRSEWLSPPLVAMTFGYFLPFVSIIHFHSLINFPTPEKYFSIW